MASKFTQEEKINSAKKLANQVVGTENAGLGIKPYYAEEFPWTPIINPNKIWSEIEQISGATNEAQAISVAAAIPTIIERVKIRLTVLNTSNNNAYVARSIFNNNSSQVLDNWIQPQLIRTTSDDASLGYSVNLYHGDPDSGGTLLPTNFEGLDGENSWEWSYSSGVLVVAEDENSTYRSFYNTNGLWIQGFRYIGQTGGGIISGGTGVIPDDLEVLNNQITQNNTFQNYQPVYYNSNTGNYELSIASGSTVGQYVVYNVTPSSFQIAYSGFLEAPSHGLGSNGDVLYVSQTSGGTYTNIEPINGVINPMLEIIDNNLLLIINTPAYIINDSVIDNVTILEDWQINLNYNTNELVKFNLGTYRCLIPHVSNIFQNDLLANRWELITGLYQEIYTFLGDGINTNVTINHNFNNKNIIFFIRNTITDIIINTNNLILSTPTNNTINIQGNLISGNTYSISIQGLII